MKEKLCKAGQGMICVVLLLTLLACQGQATSTPTVEIEGHSQELLPGERILLDAVISPPGVKGPITYKWSVTGGSLSKDDTPTVQFTAPDSAGEVAVDVVVTIGETSFPIKETFQVVPPVTPTQPPTETPAQEPTATPTLPPTQMPTEEPTTTTSTSMPTSMLTPIPPLTPFPTPHTIVRTESLTGWVPSWDGDSSMKVDLVQGRTNGAVEIAYYLARGGWLIITKGVDPQVLSGTTGISFYHKGSGAPNTIEFKLMLRYPDDTDDTTYGVSWHQATDTGGDWKLEDVPYSDFACWWPAENCVAHPKLDLTKVLRMDFAVSNKPDFGDQVGSGSVAFDDVVGIMP
jgi:Carbohydrate binding domain (family 11)